MLNWLKRRAKVTFQNRYPNILRRSNSPEMFLTEQTMIKQESNEAKSIKLLVFNTDGKEYWLDVPLDMTLDKVKLMAVGHFYDPREAVAGIPKFGGEPSEASNQYRLILARDYRTLLEEKSVAAEELMDHDEILLVECRSRHSKPPLIRESRYINLEDSTPTMDKIWKETENISINNWNKADDSSAFTLDFKIALRQIFITMIEASIHLITPEDNAADLFVLVFEHLEKRHKPQVDKSSLKQLTDMGFSEARAITALQYKGNVVEAMEWLLDETNKMQFGSETESDVLLIPPERRKSFFMSGEDPAEKVMQEFNKYVEKWFVPDARALQNLKDLGYGEDISKQALRITCNNEKLAKEFLEGKTVGENFQKGFDRDSPIMAAILDSPIVQVALSKPKTLFALMVLCETPSNVNVWLSDPETHPVVSQVLRIYHLEKHRLKESITVNNSAASESQNEPMETSHVGTDPMFLTVEMSQPNSLQSESSASGEESPQKAEGGEFIPLSDSVAGFWSEEVIVMEQDSDDMDEYDSVEPV